MSCIGLRLVLPASKSGRIPVDVWLFCFSGSRAVPKNRADGIFTLATRSIFATIDAMISSTVISRRHGLLVKSLCFCDRRKIILKRLRTILRYIKTDDWIITWILGYVLSSTELLPRKRAANNLMLRCAAFKNTPHEIAMASPWLGGIQTTHLTLRLLRYLPLI